MMQWRDIETAPKDGSKLLLLVFPKEGYRDDYDGCLHIGFWGSELMHEPCFWCDWNDANDENPHYFAMIHPTHWMPLPDPPVENVVGELTIKSNHLRIRN